eukprot:scaffold59012_cov69-Cyclotella_meneghiniana.AAC.2
MTVRTTSLLLLSILVATTKASLLRGDANQQQRELQSHCPCWNQKYLYFTLRGLHIEKYVRAAPGNADEAVTSNVSTLTTSFRELSVTGYNSLPSGVNLSSCEVRDEIGKVLDVHEGLTTSQYLDCRNLLDEWYDRCPPEVFEDDTGFVNLRDRTLYIRNAVTEPNTPLSYGPRNYIHTPNNDANGRKHLVTDRFPDNSQVFFAGPYNGGSNIDPNVQFNLKQVTCPAPDDDACATYNNCYTIESLSTGTSRTVWRVYAEDFPCAQTEPPSCQVNFETGFGIQSQDGSAEVLDSMKWQFIQEGSSYRIVNAANGRHLLVQQVRVQQEQTYDGSYSFGAAFNDDRSPDEGLWDLVPVIPTELEGYQYQGRGYCVNSSGQTYSFHRLVNINKVEVCGVRCRQEADLNQYTLVGVNYHPDVNGGNCNCMQVSDANSGKIEGVLDYSDARELCYSLVSYRTPQAENPSSSTPNSYTPSEESCAECVNICEIKSDTDEEYNECISTKCIDNLGCQI